MKKLKQKKTAMLCYKNLVKNNMQQVQENINSFHYSTMSEQTLLDLIDEPSTTIDILIKIINENNVISKSLVNRLVKTSKVGYIALRKYIQRLDHDLMKKKYCVYLEQARDIKKTQLKKLMQTEKNYPYKIIKSNLI